MYAEDSFFTLTMGGRIGLVIISTLLVLLCVIVVWRFAKGRPVPIRFLIGFGTFAAFVWLAPQVYYTYYIFLLEGLPWQIVTQLPSLENLFRLLTFSEQANLSFHSQGVFGWALVITGLLRR